MFTSELLRKEMNQTFEGKLHETSKAHTSERACIAVSNVDNVGSFQMFTILFLAKKLFYVIKIVMLFIL